MIFSYVIIDYSGCYFLVQSESVYLLKFLKSKTKHGEGFG